MLSWFQKLGFALLLLPFLLVGCSSDKHTTLPDRTVNDLYNSAMDKAQENDYKEAIVLFDEIERQHPYSPWAPKAQIMSAYINYYNAKYDDSILVLDRFLRFHPGHKYAPYAYYLKGLCYYEQISDITRDQKMTDMAMQTFQRLIMLYPQTPYAQNAQRKVLLTYNNLAGKEMDIGRYYLQQKRYAPALNRFAEVIRSYQTSMYTQEALYRMTEAYLALGLKKEAILVASVLGHNYQRSKWYKKAYALIKENTSVKTE